MVQSKRSTKTLVLQPRMTAAQATAEVALDSSTATQATLMHRFAHTKIDKVVSQQAMWLSQLLVLMKARSLNLCTSNEWSLFAIMSDFSTQSPRSFSSMQTRVAQVIEKKQFGWMQQTIDFGQAEHKVDAGALINLACDGWSDTDNEIVGLTAHWIDRNFVLRRMYVDLIDAGDAANRHAPDLQSEVITNVLADRLPSNVVTFVTTTDNAAGARVLGDSLSGGKGNTCSCHLLNLTVKTTIFDLDSISVASWHEILCCVYSTANGIKRAKLGDAFVHFQNANDFDSARKISRPCATRWHSLLDTMSTYEDTYEALVSARGTDTKIGELIATIGVLDASQIITLRAVREQLNHVRRASRALESSIFLTQHHLSAIITDLILKLDHFTRDSLSSTPVARQVIGLVVRQIVDRFAQSLFCASWATMAASLSPSYAAMSHIDDKFVAVCERWLDMSKQPFSFTLPDTRNARWHETWLRKLQYEVAHHLGSELITARRLTSVVSNAPVQAEYSNEVNENDRASVRTFNDGSSSDDEAIPMHDIDQLRTAATKDIERLGKVSAFLNQADERYDRPANLAHDAALEYALAAKENRRDQAALDYTLTFWRVIQLGKWEQLEQEFSLTPRDGAKFGQFLRFFNPIIKAILSIQASSAECERLFSLASLHLKSAPALKNATLRERIVIQSYTKTPEGPFGHDPSEWRDACIDLASETLDLTTLSDAVD